MSKVANLLDRIQKWQVEEMGNDCSICYGNNANTACAACGWWGRVPPETGGGVTTAATEILDAVVSPDRPAPDGFTAEWDFTIWNVGHVFMWSDVYDDWLDCGVRLTVKPNMTLGEAYEDHMDEPMWLEYAIFFACDD